MNEQTWWNYVDKSRWESGPWMNEPDKIQWTDEKTGLDCLIVRGPVGALCGYVGVPNGHPVYGKDEGDVDASVHGGLTYAGKCQEGGTVCHVPEAGRPTDVWWLGFDCAHGYDYIPDVFDCAHGYDYIPDVSHHFPSDDESSYKDVWYVRKQCASLARQLAETNHE